MQEAVIMFFVFVLGAVVGSFFNVVLLRKNTGESIVYGNSRCFSCGKKLTALSMVPILSFIWQKGRCSHCGTKISLQYPLVELSIGLLSFFIYYKTPFLWFFYFPAFASLFLLAGYDFKNKIIDKNFLYIFGFFAIIEFLMRKNFAEDLISSFFIALFFYALWRVSGGVWMGRGDTDMAFLISLFLGFSLNLMMLLLSFWLGGFIGAALLLFQKKHFNLKSEIPFGPFLAAAALIVWSFREFFNLIYGIIF